MLRAVFLDAGPLSQVTQRRGKSADADDCRTWLSDLISKNVRVYVPEITDYEVRRELLRANKTEGIRRLDDFKSAARYLPLNSEAIELASKLWADARNKGFATADNKALDCDVILAAQVLTSNVPLASCVVATTNVRHISHFVAAAHWRDIHAQTIPQELLALEEEPVPVTDTELLENMLREFYSIPAENNIEIQLIGHRSFEAHETYPDGSVAREIVGNVRIELYRGKRYIRAILPLIEPELLPGQIQVFWKIYDVLKARMDAGEKSGEKRIFLAKNTEFPELFTVRGKGLSVAGRIRENMLPVWHRIDHRLRLRGYLASMSYREDDEVNWELYTYPSEILGRLS